MTFVNVDCTYIFLSCGDFSGFKCQLYFASDEELCLAEEMVQNSQQDASQGLMVTGQFQKQNSRLPHNQCLEPTSSYQATENVLLSNQLYYEQTHLKRNILDSSHIQNIQPSAIIEQYFSQTVPVFDVDQNQYDKLVKEKAMAIDRDSKGFMPYRKPAYSGSNISNDENKHYYDIHCHTGRPVTNIKTNVSVNMIYPPPSNNQHNSHQTVSPRHTYGQVVAWVSEEPSSGNPEKSQLLAKQCKTPLRIPISSPLQTHSKRYII